MPAPAASNRPSLWETLPAGKQLEVLTSLATRRGRQFKSQYPNVLSVGVGHKTTAGELKPELCLGFLVNKKTDSAKRQVPPAISTVVQVEGRRRKVEVPTDVEELGDSGPQLATNAADGVLIASPSAPHLRATGAICCLVKLNGQPDLFVLSCHHVLTLSGRVGGCKVVPDAVVADLSGVPYAQLFDFVPMAAGIKSQLDAAISLVQPGQSVTWAHSGPQPTSVDFGLSKPQNCAIYVPGRRLGATYVKTWQEVQLQYPGCVVQIACAYQFAANTQPGDSGSPVIGNDGTLYAMHFWGSPTTSFSMALPAGLLFASGVFRSGDLKLV